MAPKFEIRPMTRADWDEVGELIYLSTNYWYEANGRSRIFGCDPKEAQLFCEVYEDLDPGCCLLATQPESGRVMGSCFYHPRETHVSLGIMNVHPNHFGAKVAGALLAEVIAFAESEGLPVRLVSSAMNLDSFSLYTRKQFRPIRSFQDMYVAVPETGLPNQPAVDSVREATLEDIPAMVQLEAELTGIRRAKDHRYFIENRLGIWHTSVSLDSTGQIDGFLSSVAHPASNMLGPGCARTAESAFSLIRAELDGQRGRSPVFLVPTDDQKLVSALYGIGARNCELHFAQVRGETQPSQGVVMPTFMPETG
ncbi:MAG: GNAT family N-acetyltransferase [Verrucomicrobiota bacterium]